MIDIYKILDKALAESAFQLSGCDSAQSLNEKMKSRALKKAFKTKGQAAFPDIKSDDDIVFVRGIPKEKALKLLKRACHDVSNFHPEYMEKAVRWSDDQIFGVFNKHDKRNVLAMASVSYNGDKSGAAYLHEMTGFIKGYGKKLVMWLLQKFKKVYGQIALEGSGAKDDPYKPNEKLRDKFYAAIPGLKIYRVENSIWDCPADFFYYGISDESIKEFLENTYSSKEHNAIDESTHISQTMYRFTIDGAGIYEAAKELIFSRFDTDEAKRRWSEVLAASSWLPKPNFQYSREYESWFTFAGKRLFEKTVLRVLRSLGIDSIELCESAVDDSRVVYSDMYQVIVKLDNINEDDEAGIDGIKHMFDEVVAQYKAQLGIDLSYMDFKVDSQPVYTNGKPCYEHDEDECAGDWTSLGWIRLNPDMKSVMDRYGIECTGSDCIEQFTKLIIAHELAHEVWNNIADAQLKSEMLAKARSQGFTTEYLQTVKPSKLDEETFCEWLASQIAPQRKDISFPEEEIQDLARRKHIITHRVLDDAVKFNAGNIVDTPWQIPYEVVKKTVVNDIYDSPYADQLSQEQLDYLRQFDSIAVLDLNARYDPPYSLSQIKAKYPEHVYRKLANDPVHR